MVWNDFRNGANSDLYAQRISASGEVLWTLDGVPVVTGPGYQAATAIVADGAGGVIVAWHHSLHPVNDIYAQRIDGSGALLWTPGGVALCTAANAQFSPCIASDGAGGAIVAWHDFRFDQFEYPDIFAQRVDASGTVLWTHNGVAVCTVDEHQEGTQIVSDGSGGAIIGWWDYRNFTNTDIFAQRIDAAGAALWPVNGVNASPAAQFQLYVRIVSDGAAGAILTWQDHRNSTPDVYVQRLNASGAPQWGVSGLSISTTGWDVRPELVSDGAGGAIITWEDSLTSDSRHDIFMQRINASGAPQWTAGGVGLAVALGNQTSVTMAADGSGGTFVAWEDSTTGTSTHYDIRVQRINASGAFQWTPGGVAVCDLFNAQRAPVILAAAGGGAIVAWQDFRTGSNYDIYALRLGPEGSIPTGVDHTPPVSAVALGSNHPNPFSGATAIDLDLVRDANVAVDVFDVAGRRVRQLNFGRIAAGSKSMTFDGMGDDGRPLPSGIYFYRINASGVTATRKMVIAR